MKPEEDQKGKKEKRKKKEKEKHKGKKDMGKEERYVDVTPRLHRWACPRVTHPPPWYVPESKHTFGMRQVVLHTRLVVLRMNRRRGQNPREEQFKAQVKDTVFAEQDRKDRLIVVVVVAAGA